MTLKHIVVHQEHIETIKTQRQQTLVFKHSTHPYNMYLVQNTLH